VGSRRKITPPKKDRPKVEIGIEECSDQIFQDSMHVVLQSLQIMEDQDQTFEIGEVVEMRIEIIIRKPGSKNPLPLIKLKVH
jgi:hypothetical protein